MCNSLIILVVYYIFKVRIRTYTPPLTIATSSSICTRSGSEPPYHSGAAAADSLRPLHNHSVCTSASPAAPLQYRSAHQWQSPFKDTRVTTRVPFDALLPPPDGKKTHIHDQDTMAGVIIRGVRIKQKRQTWTTPRPDAAHVKL